MTPSPLLVEEKLNWRFPMPFWIANIAELFERAAYYGMYIVLTLYLTDVVGFTDVEVGWVGGIFSAGIFFFPTIMGAIADKMGFRRALILAFALLSLGYFGLGAFPSKLATLGALAIVVAGGAFVKPIISGTVAKCSDERHRARAFSIFYWMVNIGAFSGKTIAAPLREHLGLQYINYYASAMAFVGLIWVALFFREVKRDGPGRTVGDVLRGMGRVLVNFRFMALILIVAGFWLIQGQLYATMPKYILRLVGAGAKPEWLANVNPFVVVLCVVPVTHLIRRFKPENAIGIALIIITLSASSVAIAPFIAPSTGKSVSILGLFSLHPVTVTLVIAIALQGFSECFLSPKFLEYASRQAPPGEEGLYMGYQHLTNFIAFGAAFVLSGYLLDKYCPDPKTLGLESHAQWQAAIEAGSAMPAAYAHAHYIWFVYAAVGMMALLALCAFRLVTSRLDRSRVAM